jgi:hypothetical protein
MHLLEEVLKREIHGRSIISIAVISNDDVVVV